MAPFNVNQVQLPGLKMQYSHVGEGQNVVLFVHGYSASSNAWRGVMESLPSDFRAVAVDIRGSGDSDKPDSGYTIQQMSEDLYQLALILDLKDFTMVGHSMGGMITARFALEHPELLKSIILVDPASVDGLELPPEAKQMLMAVLKSRKKDEIEMVLRMMAFAPDAELDQSVVEVSVEDSIKASDNFLDQAMAELEALRWGDQLSGIDLPTLVIHGDRDAAVPLADSIKIYERVSGCSLQVFYGCGHSPHLEAQEDFTRLLVSFARNPRRRIEITG